MKRSRYSIVSAIFFTLSAVWAGGWTQFPSPEVSTKWGLSSVSFPAPDNGWAVGTDFEKVGLVKAATKGIILHFQNGKWINIDPPQVSSDWNLNQTFFVSTEEGWAVGHNRENKKGLLLHYTGASWSVVELPSVSLQDWTLLDLFFIDRSEGWIVGGSPEGEGAAILHYKNGSWTLEGTEELLMGHLLYAVNAISSENLWLGGQREGHLITGTFVTSRPRGTYEVQYANGEWSEVKQPLLLRNVIRTDYYFFRPNDGWVVGYMPSLKIGNDLGKIAHWNGKKWKEEKLPKVSKWWNLEAVDFSSLKYGWAVGINSSKNCGVLMEYKKKKWTLLKKKKLPNVSKDWWLKDVVYDGTNDWWAVGMDGKGNKGVIFHLSP